jgi:branched-chain amino acid transport system substrate-binding protein
MHYADSLDAARNKQFRTAYAPASDRSRTYGGAALRRRHLLAQPAAVKGDIRNKQALYQSLETQTIDSPRGKWTMSKAHNPVQDIYLRRVENKDNKVIGIAAKALADSGAGCKLA